MHIHSFLVSHSANLGRFRNLPYIFSKYGNLWTENCYKYRFLDIQKILYTMIEYFGHFRNKCSVLHESKSNTRQRKPKYHPVTHDRQQRRRTLQTARNFGYWESSSARSIGSLFDRFEKVCRFCANFAFCWHAWCRLDLWMVRLKWLKNSLSYYR